MSVAIVTGAGGLVGGEAAQFLHSRMDLVVCIDNDMRRQFFGEDASTERHLDQLGRNFKNIALVKADIRDEAEISRIFEKYSSDIKLVVHCAAQPSHDWAMREPMTDFSINATGTLNLLEATRLHAGQAVFIHCSTNKVYGDAPNRLGFVELERRFDLPKDHQMYKLGIGETFPVDQSLHSIFGASKLASDVMAQEYGRYFGIKTGIFRGGCITGPKHAGAELHGFLNYLFKCTIKRIPYTVYGYQGKQVRDNIHSFDLVNMFWHFYNNPRPGEVFNAGGSRHSNCSLLEAVEIAERLSGNKLEYSIADQNRKGDHQWYISDMSKFKRMYPDWSYKYDLNNICEEIFSVLCNAE